MELFQSRRRILFPALLILSVFYISLLHTGCATTGGFETDNSHSEVSVEDALIQSVQNVLWKEVTPYAVYGKIKSKTIPFTAHVVRLQLDTPNLQIVTWPAADTAVELFNGENAFPGLKGSRFVSETGSEIAFNTTPYKKLSAGKRSLAGIHKTEGKVLSPEVEKYACITLKNGKARIIEHQNEKDTEEAVFASGGFYSILKDGEVLPFKYESRDSRLALGLTSDGSTLFILAVEGELKFLRPFSRGLSYPECAVLLKNLGADDAIEMDGGSSASLFVNGKNVMSYPSLQKNGAWLGFQLKH